MTGSSRWPSGSCGNASTKMTVWPVLVPELVEGVLVDAGVLEPSSRSGARALPEPRNDA